MKALAQTLASRREQWSGKPPATDADLENLETAVAIKLPAEYLELLRVNNGGEGELALPPLWLQLHGAHTVAEFASQGWDPDMDGYLVIGSNGGLERIAFDTRGSHPWPVVMFDPIAGADSIEVIASSITQFIDAIGREYNEAI